MNRKKFEYLANLRENSAYPSLRRGIAILTKIAYFAAILELISGVAWGGAVILNVCRNLYFIDWPAIAIGFAIVIGSLLFAAIIAFGAEVIRDIALVAVDFADSKLDRNSPQGS